MNATLNTQACLPSFYIAFSVHGTDSWIVATSTEDVVCALSIPMGVRPDGAAEIVASEKDRFYVGQPLELPFGGHVGGMATFTVGKSRRPMFPSRHGVKLLANRLQTGLGTPTADPKKVLDFFLDLAAAGWRIAKYKDFVSYHKDRLSAEKVQKLVDRAEGDANPENIVPTFYVAFSIHGTDSWISAHTTPDLVNGARSLYGNDFGPKKGSSFQVGDSHFQVGQTLRIIAAIENGFPCADVFTIGTSRRSGYDPEQGIKLLARGLLTESNKPTTDPKKVLAYFTQLAKAGWVIKDYENFLDRFAHRLSGPDVAAFRDAEAGFSGINDGNAIGVAEQPLSKEESSRISGHALVLGDARILSEKVTAETLNAALVKHHINLATYIQKTGKASQRRWEAFFGEFGEDGKGAVSNSPVNAVNKLLFDNTK